MTMLIRAIFVVWTLSGVSTGLTQAFGEPVLLDTHTEYIHLGPHVTYLEDKTGNMAREDVMAPSKEAGWKKAGSETLNFGYTDSVFWVRVDLVNQADKPLEFLIEIAYPVLDHIQVFITGDKGESTLTMGDKLPFSSRPVKHRNFVFPILFSAHQSLGLLMRFQTTSSMQIPLNLYRERALLEKNQMEMMSLGLYYGSMIIMILYNLFVFLSVREANYLYYVIYVVCMATFLASLNGTTYQYLWPESLWWNDQVLVVSLSGVVLFAILFTVGFLKLKEFKPLSYKVFMVFAILAGLILLLSPLIPYKIGIISTILLALVSIFFCIIMTVIRWAEGFKSARFYAVAWFAMLTGGVILAMSKFNILPRNVFTEYATQYGSVLEVMLLSFALADRLNIEKKERIQAQNIAHQQERNARIANERALQNERKAREAREQAYQIQKKATETLEVNVQERTAELNDTLDKVREANSHIMSSLRYARMIQLSMLPDSRKVSAHFPRHFIWWRPRDIVGGDFYFMEKIGSYAVVAVADCTGHGVPGAFMTIIANSELKRIIKGEKCYDTGEILARLNRRMRKSLKQDTDHAMSNDGLDIGVCVYDCNTRWLSYSGARMNLIYTKGKALNILKGDKHSVGYVSSDRDYEYSVQQVQVKENMTFYLFTDGITDQLGDNRRLRFGTKRMKSLIESHKGQSLGEQYESYQRALDEHRGEREQIDDMTMVAFCPE